MNKPVYTSKDPARPTAEELDEMTDYYETSQKAIPPKGEMEKPNGKR